MKKSVAASLLSLPLLIALTAVVPARARLLVPLDSLGKSPAEALHIGMPDDSVTALPDTILRLTEADYEAVARELGIEVATMKAVTEIEAGRTHEGFSAPGKPLANFDMTMFNKFARINKIDLARARRSHPEIFTRRGSGQAAVNRRIDAAMKLDRTTAIQGVFWGMFQIGGFNWKLCGCSSIEEFYERMCRSERDQLELFARFVENTGMVRHLRTKNWAAFARQYNGPSYASRGYHTKLANAYARHSRRR